MSKPMYCQQHGDLLAAPRSYRCESAEPGHELGEITDKQVLAAARAAYTFDSEVSAMSGKPFDPDLSALPEWAMQTHLDKARAALEAARRAET